MRIIIIFCFAFAYKIDFSLGTTITTSIITSNNDSTTTIASSTEVGSGLGEDSGLGGLDGIEGQGGLDGLEGSGDNLTLDLTTSVAR